MQRGADREQAVGLAQMGSRHLGLRADSKTSRLRGAREFVAFRRTVTRLDDEAGLLEGGSTVGMDVLK